MSAGCRAFSRSRALLAAGDRLPIDDAGARAQSGHRLDDQREAIGQVIAGAAIEPHAVAILAGDDAEAVVLDFVQPSLAGRRLRRIGGQAWRDEAEREGHDPAIGRWRGACQRPSSGRAPAVDMASAVTETGRPRAGRGGALHQSRPGSQNAWPGFPCASRQSSSGKQ
jgi:hypothetical protein